MSQCRSHLCLGSEVSGYPLITYLQYDDFIYVVVYSKILKSFFSECRHKYIHVILCFSHNTKKGKGSPYSITERRVPEPIPVLCIQPAGDVSHKPGGRLPLLSARPAVTPATLKRAATSFAAW